MTTASRRIDPTDLFEFCMNTMDAAGLAHENARVTAEVLVTTDTWGVFTHGTKQLRGLLRNFREGKMALDHAAELVAEGPSWALFDGNRSNPMVTSNAAMNVAIDKAKSTGIAYVTVRRSGHFGAAGYYANMAASKGLIGLAMCNVDPGVAVPGSRGPVLGTNPLAYAVPTGTGHPIFLDIATSVVAASKVYAAQSNGTSIPDNWLVDANGHPTTDPSGYPEVGALLPMAGHKGYGIALLIEILTGVVAGGAVGNELVSWVRGPEKVNQSFAFIAIDVSMFGVRGEFNERIEKLTQEIREAPKAQGSERIFLPGEREWENRERALKEGIRLPPDVVSNLVGVAEDYSLSSEWLRWRE